MELAPRKCEGALRIDLPVSGAEYPPAGAFYHKMGSAVSGKGFEHLDKALAIEQKALGSGHVKAAALKFSLSGVYLAQGLCERAKELSTGCAKIY